MKLTKVYHRGIPVDDLDRAKASTQTSCVWNT
jgi:hypothetical protein